MGNKKFIPIIIIAVAVSLSVLYFDVFRLFEGNGSFIESSGTIEVTEIELSSKLAGRVVRISKEEGESVKKGELVVALDYDELNAQRSSLQANFTNAERHYQRVRELYQTGSVSKQDYDNALAAYRMAKANLQQVGASIGNAVIHAPLDGIVLEKNLEPGEMAFPGTPIVTIADLRRPWIKVYVDEKRLGFVRLGQKAQVFIDSYPNRSFSGTVTAISNKAEFTPKTIQTKDERVKLMFAVKVAIENPELILKPGMPADARIALEPKK